MVTHFFINTQRSGSIHELNSNGHNRPKHVKSVKMPIEPGQTINFTSPYAGPIQAAFDGNGETVSFDFANIGQHAFWASNADDLAFEAALAAGDFDGAELVTPGFEVHSRLSRMQHSMTGPTWNTAAGLTAMTTRHVHNLPHLLASRSEADPFAYMQTANLSSWSQAVGATAAQQVTDMGFAPMPLAHQFQHLQRALS